MNELPKIEDKFRSFELRNQWGKDFFFKRDGRKKTVNSKTAISITCFIFISLAIFLFMDEQDAFTSKQDNSPKFFMIDVLKNEDPKIELPDGRKKLESSNLKEKKRGESREVSFKGPEIVNRPRDLSGILPGTMLLATLINGATDGITRAIIDEELSINGEVKIEAGALLIGHGSSGEERLQINFSQLVFPNATFVDISAQACDYSDKTIGLKGSIIGDRAINIAGSIGLGFIGGMTEGLQDSRGEFGAVIRNPSLKNSLLNATSVTALEQSKNLMTDLKDRKLRVQVKEGTKLYVLFEAIK